MPKNIRFRFGRIDCPSSERPTPQEIRDGIESLDNRYIDREEKKIVEGEEPIQFKHKGAAQEIRTLPDGTEYCFYTYFTDTEESAMIRDGDDGEEEDIRLAVEIVRVLYLENGLFAYENSNRLQRAWIPQFIDEMTGYEASADTRYKALPQSILGEFYNNKDQISRLRLEKNDDNSDPDLSDDPSFKEQTKAIMQQTGSLRYTKEEKSLNEVNELQELTNDDEIEIAAIVGKNDDELSKEVYAIGSTLLNWSLNVWNEEDWAGKRDLIEEDLNPYLRRLM